MEIGLSGQQSTLIGVAKSLRAYVTSLNAQLIIKAKQLFHAWKKCFVKSAMRNYFHTFSSIEITLICIK